MDKNYTILVGLILMMLGAFATSGGAFQAKRQGSFKLMKIALTIMALGWVVFLFGYYIQETPPAAQQAQEAPAQPPADITKPSPSVPVSPASMEPSHSNNIE